MIVFGDSRLIDKKSHLSGLEFVRKKLLSYNSKRGWLKVSADEVYTEHQQKKVRRVDLKG
jgi:hypothetical protein